MEHPGDAGHRPASRHATDPQLATQPRDLSLTLLSRHNPAVLTAGLATAADDPGLPAASPGD